jgi:hypothetical protein
MKNENAKVLNLEKHYNRISRKEHTTEMLVRAAWKFSKSALWPRHKIIFNDVETCKDFIRNYLNLHGNTEKSFKSFCTRILLAKEYFNLYPHRLVRPQEWLTADNDEGFVITLTFYQQLLYKRHHCSSFRKDLKDMTNAYYDYSFQPTEINIRNGRKLLRIYPKNELLNLFNASINH